MAHIDSGQLERSGPMANGVCGRAGPPLKCASRNGIFRPGSAFSLPEILNVALLRLRFPKNPAALIRTNPAIYESTPGKQVFMIN
jgi:hypothetical protein